MTSIHLRPNVITLKSFFPFRTFTHLAQNVITFRDLLPLGSFITFRSSIRNRPVFMHKKGYFSVIFVTEPLCIPGSRKKICIENKIGSGSTLWKTDIWTVAEVNIFRSEDWDANFQE